MSLDLFWLAFIIKTFYTRVNIRENLHKEPRMSMTISQPLLNPQPTGSFFFQNVILFSNLVKWWIGVRQPMVIFVIRDTCTTCINECVCITWLSMKYNFLHLLVYHWGHNGSVQLPLNTEQHLHESMIIHHFYQHDVVQNDRWYILKFHGNVCCYIIWLVNVRQNSWRYNLEYNLKYKHGQGVLCIHNVAW